MMPTTENAFFQSNLNNICSFGPDIFKLDILRNICLQLFFASFNSIFSSVAWDVGSLILLSKLLKIEKVDGTVFTGGDKER